MKVKWHMKVLSLVSEVVSEIEEEAPAILDEDEQIVILKHRAGQLKSKGHHY